MIIIHLNNVSDKADTSGDQGTRVSLDQRWVSSMGLATGDNMNAIDVRYPRQRYSPDGNTQLDPHMEAGSEITHIVIRLISHSMVHTVDIVHYNKFTGVQYKGHLLHAHNR